jgi:hypothetical protein
MFTDKDLFKSDPRSYTLEMVEMGLVDAQSLLEACLGYMSHDDVRGMLEANELAPEEDEDEEEELDPMDDFNYVGSRHHY